MLLAGLRVLTNAKRLMRYAYQAYVEPTIY